MSSLGSNVSTAIQPVILCGGAGTRLWPLSRQSYPKQFMPLLGGRSLLALTLERVRELNPDPWCVASIDHRFLVIDAFEQCQMNGKVLLEPTGRNTAAAVAVAALHADDDALLLFCPADHYIPDAAAFVERVRQAEAAALSGALVTFGVVPTFPSSGYGYIEAGDAWEDSGALLVQRAVQRGDIAITDKGLGMAAQKLKIDAFKQARAAIAAAQTENRINAVIGKGLVQIA